MKERNSIDNKYKWDLSKLCESDEKFFYEVEKLKPYIEKIKLFEGKLEDNDELYACWEIEDEFAIKGNPLYLYVLCRCDEDQRDSKATEMEQTISKIYSKYSEASSYISPEISKFSKEKLEGLFNNPKFSKFKPYIKDYLRVKDHILSKEVENLISGMGEFLGTNGEVFDKFLDADAKYEDAVDSKGEKHPLNGATFSEYLMNGDRKLRESAFVNFHKMFENNINFLTANYVSSVKNRCFFAKKRGYSSALNASIYNEEASESVYNKLIQKVRENVDIVSKYFEIKAKLLGVSDFNLYDKFAPVGEEDNSKISFEESINTICKAVAPLGEEYVNLIKKSTTEKWIDVYPNKGKNSGAHVNHVYGKTPIVLLNFNEKKQYVSTIAHELGHALHSYYSNKNQPYQTAGYVIFVAEVASTVNEMLLWRYNLKNCKSKKEKIKLYDDLFEMVNSTIFRQTMFAEFEANCHAMEEAGEPLTKDKLCAKYYELNKYYYGDKVNLVEGIKYEWARIPHFFSAFYVYKYATGLICALGLSKKIAEGDEEAIARYIKFLSSGSSKNPIELLALAGANLEEDATFDDVFSWLRQMLKEWEESI